LSGKTKSCGCLKKRRFVEYITRRAENLSAASQKLCFHVLKAAGNLVNAATMAGRRLHLPAAIVVAASRLHGSKLLADVARRVQRTFTTTEQKHIAWHRRHPQNVTRGPELVFNGDDVTDLMCLFPPGFVINLEKRKEI
jgi:hypothetical protein